MHLAVWIPVAIIVVIVLWYILTYNKFRRMKVMIQEAWSGIDVQLKRKANIIPNLVDSIKMQMNIESDLLKKLTELRGGLASDDHVEAIKANEQINALMPSINAVAENYPTLGTNESFLRLMGDIRDAEDKIAYARNRYNISVSRYNMDIVSIPNNIVAGMMRLEAEPMFEISETVRKDTDDMRISQL